MKIENQKLNKLNLISLVIWQVHGLLLCWGW